MDVVFGRRTAEMEYPPGVILALPGDQQVAELHAQTDAFLVEPLREFRVFRDLPVRETDRTDPAGPPEPELLDDLYFVTISVPEMPLHAAC
ncbi:hypothetical protein ABZU75_19245 [Streptosporangium sp. NPDC005286]|uniref:hypothetical protein n=1 Tax=Streptosporangium sp. NPDC005286 TaxID=3154463 RepID=UPI0033B69A4E